MIPVILSLCAVILSFASADPAMLAYSAFPSPYFDEHADELKGVYDGLFFIAGDWEKGLETNLGWDGKPPTTEWRAQVAENVRNLRAAGITENLLGVHFPEEGSWPTPDSLQSAEFTAYMAGHFRQLAQSARELGFMGVCIDVEYCYKRYDLDHPMYVEKGCSHEVLLKCAEAQGRAVMEAVLEGFPDAVVFLLPGELHGRPIGRVFTHAMINVMAEKDAPGGVHLGYERAYSLHEGPISQVALSRAGDAAAELYFGKKTLAYWKKRCTVAPGVWPLHRMETGGKDYPIQSWAQELDELRGQMALLRMTAKRYIWSYSGAPMWYKPGPNAARCGIKPGKAPGMTQVINEWRNILQGDDRPTDPRTLKVVDDMKAYDAGTIGFSQLCERFGTPASWMVLTPMRNPFDANANAPVTAFALPPLQTAPLEGRDGPLCWKKFDNYEAMGCVSGTRPLEWLNTDAACGYWASDVIVSAETPILLHANWDDGAVFWLNGKVVLDRSHYPERGHGMTYKDRYIFEESVSVLLRAGANRIGVANPTAFGQWGFSLRITGMDGFPTGDLRFEMPELADAGK
jgi:hypothetical protein